MSVTFAEKELNELNKKLVRETETLVTMENQVDLSKVKVRMIMSKKGQVKRILSNELNNEKPKLSYKMRKKLLKLMSV